MIKISETALTNQILQYLRYHKILCWKNRNTGLFRDGRWTPAIMKGVPDIVGILGSNQAGRTLLIEVKVGNNKPTGAQSFFIDEAKKQGALCFVAYSIEDVQRNLDEANYNG